MICSQIFNSVLKQTSFLPFIQAFKSSVQKMLMFSIKIHSPAMCKNRNPLSENTINFQPCKFVTLQGYLTKLQLCCVTFLPLSLNWVNITEVQKLKVKQNN